jgi:hypothetical protein
MAGRAVRAALSVGVRAAERAGNPLRLGTEPAEAAARHASRRGRRRGGELQGPHPRLFTRRLEPGPGLRQHRLADPGIRPQRRLPARDRQEPLRLGLCAHGTRRQRRQYLGDRQGLRHGRQVQPGRPRRDGVRLQVGKLRSRGPRARAQRQPAAAARRRPLPPADRRDLGSGRQHLHQRRLRERPRRQIRQERRMAQIVGQARQGPRRVQLGPHHRGRRARQYLCRRPQQPAHPGVRRRRQPPARDQDRRALRRQRQAGDRQQAGSEHLSADRRQPDAGRALGALHHAAAQPGALQLRLLSGPHLQAQPRRQGAGLSRQVGQAAQSSSAGSTRSPARPRTSSTSPRSSPGGCRS